MKGCYIHIYMFDDETQRKNKIYVVVACLLVACFSLWNETLDRK